MNQDVSLVARVTERCNLNCSYCYMDEKKAKDMDLDVALALVDSFCNFNTKLSHFTWIGGEPLIKGDDFFEAIVERGKQYDHEVTHSIQTNGLALKKERRDKLHSLGIKIGVSYDGVCDIQDAQRSTKSGKSVSLHVLRNVREDTRGYGLIAVATKKFLGREEEIYHNLKREGKTARLNLYSPAGEGLNAVDELLPTKEQSRDMLLKFYSLWRDDDSMFVLDPFKDMTRSLFTGASRTCDLNALMCYRIVGSDTDGDIYTCSRSTHVPEMRLGNIFDQNLEDILNHRAREKILDRHLALRSDTKKDCKWLPYCSGGCPAEAHEHTGDMMNATFYCCDVKEPLYEQISKDLEDETIRARLIRKIGFTQ